MHNKGFTVAIYSGVIPSTTFIERLIHGLLIQNVSIYLFGVLKGTRTYPKGVHVVGYRQSRIFKAFYFLKYSLLLFLHKKADKDRLDAYLRSQNRYTLYERVKCYPVLWHQPDIFHLQWAKGLDDWMWVQDFGMKLVLSLRGAHINYSPIANAKFSNMYNTYFPIVNGFHAVSSAIANEAQHYGAKAEKIKVVYSGLNLETLKPLQQKQNKVFQVISVGRPHWIKGYNYALDACKLLIDLSDLNFHYTIVGGSDDIELLYQINDLRLNNYVTLTGTKDFETVKELVRNADLLLLSSVEEGIANVVLEAMALGTLVLSTDCGGMHEVIQNGVNGFIVAKRDSRAIANAIVHIKGLGAVETASILEVALRTIKEHHTEQQMVEDMLELYHFVSEKDYTNSLP